MTFEELNRNLKENTSLFYKSFGLVDEATQNKKPDINIWSIAQNIEHLTATNQSYYPIFEKLKNGDYSAPFIARVGFIVTLIEKLILGSVEPERKQRIKTFQVWEPSASYIKEPLEQFAQSQQLLADYVHSNWSLFEKGTVISSPANKYVVYRLPVLLQIITQHQLRHLNQAKEILQLVE